MKMRRRGAQNLELMTRRKCSEHEGLCFGTRLELLNHISMFFFKFDFAGHFGHFREAIDHTEYGRFITSRGFGVIPVTL